MSNTVDLSDFVAGFLLEAEEHLHSVNQNLVATSEALKLGRPEPRAVRELFRSLHTIKGLAAMVGAEPIVDVAHEMEGLLRTADQAGGQIAEPLLDLLLQGTRAVEERVRELSSKGIAGISSAPPKLIEALVIAQQKVVTARKDSEYEITLPDDIRLSLAPADREQIIQASRAGQRVVLLEFQPSPEKAAQGLNITSVRERLAKMGELIKVLPRSSKTAPTGISFSLLIVTGSSDADLQTTIGGGDESVLNVTATRTAPSEDTTAPSTVTSESDLTEIDQPTEWLPTEQSSIRVDVRRLDEALEQLSGLFVTRFKLDRVANTLGANGTDIRELKAVIAESTRQLGRLRTAISEARMVPLAELLQRLPLVVRGITKDSDKSVNTTIQAGSAEVDKAVADKIFPAVVHLIRNAVDHAIETRAERRAAMKPEVGQLTIACDDSSGTTLVLTITDDGRGIDRDAVAAKSGRTPARDDEELLQQICMAGLSTSAAITHTSGRGMGMDIVKRTIEILGGTLSLKTTPGKGSTFTMRVPVTVTIVDVLSFVSGEQVFVAPVAIVDEIVEILPGSLTVLPAPVGAVVQPHLIQYRGKTIPLFILESLLNRTASTRLPQKALVITQGNRKVAFGIDRMVGKQEAVVRPIDDGLIRVPGMAGATDLGDGRPTLVLDLATLGASVMQNAGATL